MAALLPSLRAAVVATLAAALLIPAAADASACAQASASAAKDGSRPTARAIRCLINRERRERGLKPLRGDGKLRKAATRHSRDMVSRGYFDHVAPGGTDMIDRARAAGYLRGDFSWSLAENIGWGSGPGATAARLVRSWMRSPAHRRNILARGMRQVGVGIASGTPNGDSGTTGTLLFGRLG